jgi:hypothetical protein
VTPPPAIYGWYIDLRQINITSEDEEVYTDAGTTLREGIWEFLIQKREEAHSAKILENQNRKQSIVDRKMDIENQKWRDVKKTMKQALGIHVSNSAYVSLTMT